MTAADSGLSFKAPSAWIPMALSGAALLWLGAFFFFVPRPAVPDHDEGLGAHVFWLLMAGQLPVMGYFLLAQVPRHPGRGLMIFGIQMALWCLAWVPVYLVEHHYT